MAKDGLKDIKQAQKEIKQYTSKQIKNIGKTTKKFVSKIVKSAKQDAFRNTVSLQQYINNKGYIKGGRIVPTSCLRTKTT